MKTKRATTRQERKATHPPKLPTHFEPKSLQMVDGRPRVIRLIRRQLERLIEDAGCDSIQKELLANEAIFISVQLETMRVNALEGKPFDAGQYTQMVNCLSGLLGPGKLGLNKQAVQVLDLQTYLKSKEGKS